VFAGATVTAQAANFVGAVRRATELRTQSPQSWKEIRKAAAAARFSWARAAEHYEHELYAGA